MSIFVLRESYIFSSNLLCVNGVFVALFIMVCEGELTGLLKGWGVVVMIVMGWRMAGHKGVLLLSLKVWGR